jgi:hypothetical protein
MALTGFRVPGALPWRAIKSWLALSPCLLATYLDKCDAPVQQPALYKGAGFTYSCELQYFGCGTRQTGATRASISSKGE